MIPNVNFLLQTGGTVVVLVVDGCMDGCMYYLHDGLWSPGTVNHAARSDDYACTVFMGCNQFS